MSDRATNQLALAARWADELAHEIKNPFHAMVINLELVKRRAGEDADGARQRAEVVESELHRVHGLVDAVLKLVRPWPATDTANVGTVIDALMPVFQARAALHHIAFEHDTGGPVAASLPPADLALVLLNLMDNAIDAVGEIDEPGIRLVVQNDPDAVTIRVTDSGTGFPDLSGDPFDPGVSGHEDRPGLGLAVSRGLVETAGGTLTVDGVANGGTTVVATLPR